MADPTSAGNDKSELKRLLKMAATQPVHMAMAMGADGKPIMRMDKTKNAKALEKMLRQEAPSAKDVRFGSVSVDPTETTEATFMLNKPLGGAARKLAVFLKPAGISKVHIVLEDGTAAESADGGEAAAGAGAAAGAAVAGAEAGALAGAGTAGAALGGAAGVAAGTGGALAASGAAGSAAGAAAGVAAGATALGGAAGAVAGAGAARAANGGAGAAAGIAAGAAAVAGGAAHAASHVPATDAGAHPAGHHHHHHHHHHGHPQEAKAGHQPGDAGKGKDGAAGAQADGKKSLSNLSDADIARLVAALKAELVEVHHETQGAIQAVPPQGAAPAKAGVPNGAQAGAAKPVVKLADADAARMVAALEAAGFKVGRPADAPKDAAPKDIAPNAGVPGGAARPADPKAAAAPGVAPKDGADPKAALPAGAAHAVPAAGTVPVAAAAGATPAAGPAGPAHKEDGHAPDGHKDAGPAGAAGKDPAHPAPAVQDAAGKGAAGPAAPPKDGGVTAAALTKDLTLLVKRVMAVVKQNPGQQAELSRLAIDAQGSLRANDLETAAATMQMLEMALDDAAAEVPALADIHSRVNEEWAALRAQIDADLDSHRADALKAGADPKRLAEAHVAARAALDPVLAKLQKDVDDLKQAKNDADLAAISHSSRSGLDKLAIHLGNDKLFNLADVFFPFRPFKALGNIAQFASKIGKGLHLFR